MQVIPAITPLNGSLSVADACRLSPYLHASITWGGGGREGWWCCSYCRWASHRTVGKVVECVSEKQCSGGRTPVLNHILGCVVWRYVCMCICLYPYVQWAYSSKYRAQTKTPLKPGLDTMTLWNVIPPTGLFACDTQSHGSGVHQCTVALWQKPSGVVLCPVAPNPEV